MLEINLTAGEVAACRSVVDALVAEHQSIEDEVLLARASVFAQELPRRLRAELSQFRLNETDAAVVISGYPVDDERIGDTPQHWGQQSTGARTIAEDGFFLLCAFLLGEPFGWATQQNSRVMHDILPIRGHENLQLNSASTAKIWWHVEDAFHPYRAEYVGMMCLRNLDQVATTYAPVDAVRLPRDVVEVLFQPRFQIRPDESHRIDSERMEKLAEPQRRSYERIRQLHQQPARIAVLFGDPATPYLRLDPYFMDPTPDDPQAQEALAALSAQLDRCLTEISLAPGQVLFVDNYRAVHGRNPFRPRYDGRDRWLKRLNVARDLRKSRDARERADSRVLF
ncbi:guanitoxin biosynthesis L-enduracididine beta-hydroxylase GntD [Dactylosporangium sp. NPDC051484]|uniref:guanitoxin biosynthesis L-enduracididine beta-hydroxylase GntD n=1 Tax=Dactylosporangium sp. NPDC051484 TaxID=3154942 RepID=UPI00344FFD6D